MLLLYNEKKEKKGGQSLSRLPVGSFSGEGSCAAAGAAVCVEPPPFLRDPLHTPPSTRSKEFEKSASWVTWGLDLPYRISKLMMSGVCYCLVG